MFTRYNKLFVRPSIRSAVSQYQTDILLQVTSAVETLRNKLSNGYEGSDAERLHQMRDVPPISGHIGWAMKIRAQLNKLEGQLASVMGEKWAQLAGTEGEKLSEQIHKLTKSLDPNAYFQEWVKECRNKFESDAKNDLILVLCEDPTIAAELKRQSLKKQSSNDGHVSGSDMTTVVQSALSLHVNFDEHTLAVLKEVRNLTWLGFTVPGSIKTQANIAEMRYPSAVALRGALLTFNQASLRIPTHSYSSSKKNGVDVTVSSCLSTANAPNCRPLLKASIERFRACAMRAFGNANMDIPKLTWNMLKIDKQTFEDWLSDITDSALKLEQSVEELEVRHFMKYIHVYVACMIYVYIFTPPSLDSLS